jgi:hypothetical protein
MLFGALANGPGLLDGFLTLTLTNDQALGTKLFHTHSGVCMYVLCVCMCLYKNGIFLIGLFGTVPGKELSKS